MTAYNVYCSNCEGRTVVHISAEAVAAVANCECGNTFLVPNDTPKSREVAR